MKSGMSMISEKEGGSMIWKMLGKMANDFVRLFLHGGWVALAILGIWDWIREKPSNKLEVKKTFWESNARGIIFGKKGLVKFYSPTDTESHIFVCGGTGLGKTSSVLIPTLRSWTGTSFTVDISGDICKNVEIPNMLIYEPDEKRSTPYNIFGAIDRLEDVDEQDEALEQLAFLLMPDRMDMSDATAFFTTEGRKILTSALIAFYHAGMDFISICERIVISSWKNLLYDIDKQGCKKAIQYINSFEGTSEQNTAGCKQSCDMALKLFATNERIKATIRRPKESEACFEPSKLETNNVFVIIPDAKLKLYSPLLHIITAQSLEFFSLRPNDAKVPILFCLDEFASMGKIEITDALRKLRKKHIRIMVLTQSMADIDLIYGKEERMAMMNNFGYKLILGCSDVDTQEYFSRLIGEATGYKKGISKNGKQVTRSRTEEQERIIPPAKLANLGDNLVLLTGSGHLVLKKNYYFKKDWSMYIKDFLT